MVGGRLKFEEAEMRCGEEVWGEGVGRRGEGGRMIDSGEGVRDEGGEMRDMENG